MGVTDICPTVLCRCHAIYLPHYNLSHVVKKCDLAHCQPNKAFWHVLIILVIHQNDHRLITVHKVLSCYSNSRSSPQSLCSPILVAHRLLTVNMSSMQNSTTNARLTLNEWSSLAVSRAWYSSNGRKLWIMTSTKCCAARSTMACARWVLLQYIHIDLVDTALSMHTQETRLPLPHNID